MRNPPPPRLLRQEEAAAYLGVSANTFLAQVERGMWPEALIRDGPRVVLWDRAQLDKAIDALHPPAPGSGAGVPACDKPRRFGR